MSASEPAAAHRIGRVIFVNRFFHPDHSATSQMLSQLAFSLAEQGFAIEAVTSRQRYEDPGANLASHEETGGINVRRVWSTSFGRAGSLGRAADYVTFCFSVIVHLLRHLQPGDVVVAKTDPPLLALAVAPAAAWRRARLINWLQDVFPDVAHALRWGGASMRPVYAILGALRDRTLKSARANVVLGALMRDRLEQHGVPREAIRIISNWADDAVISPVAPEINSLRRAWGLDGTFVVAYSGNLGRAHDYETILGAIILIEEWSRPGRPDPALAARIRFLFAGGGASMEKLKRETAARALSNVLFKPYQPEERLAEGLSAGDVHLISLKPELEGLIVPSKFYGIAAAGRPALFIGDRRGEIGRLIETERCGAVFAPGDATGLANHILELARNPDLARWQGETARTLFEQRFTRSIAVQSWAGVLNEALEGRRS